MPHTQNAQTISGKIVNVAGSPIPNSYTIEDKRGKKFLARATDIAGNEALPAMSEKSVKLSKGDEVQFQESDDRQHAVEVKKLS